MSRSTLLVVAAGIVVGVAGGLSLYYSGLISRRTTEPIRTLSSASPGIQPPHAKGDINAPVAVEEFADFQCPPCAALHFELRMIEAKYRPRLRVVFRQFPLEQIHKNALLAARAAEAADIQGHFWEMHDRLYEKQDEWSNAADARQRFIGYAQYLRLDLKKFELDLDSEQTAQRVSADYRRGQSIQINSTPTVFANGREVLVESMTPKGILRSIEAAFKETGR